MTLGIALPDASIAFARKRLAAAISASPSAEIDGRPVRPDTPVDMGDSGEPPAE
jgi:hypothetical protein